MKRKILLNQSKFGIFCELFDIVVIATQIFAYWIPQKNPIPVDLLP